MGLFGDEGDVGGSGGGIVWGDVVEGGLGMMRFW